MPKSTRGEKIRLDAMETDALRKMATRTPSSERPDRGGSGAILPLNSTQKIANLGGNMMESREVASARRMLIAPLAVRRFTVGEIQSRLAQPPPIGVSMFVPESTVYNDMRILREERKKRTSDIMMTGVDEVVAELDEATKALWNQPDTVSEIVGEGENLAVKEVFNYELLYAKLAIIDRRRKVFGLDALDRRELGLTNTGPLQLNDIDSLLARINQAKTVGAIDVTPTPPTEDAAATASSVQHTPPKRSRIDTTTPVKFKRTPKP